MTAFFDSILKVNTGWIILPEILLLVLLGIVLTVDLFLNDKQRWITERTTILGLIIILFVQFFFTCAQACYGQPVLEYGNMIVNDGLGNVTKLVLYLLTIATLIYSGQYLKQKNMYTGEYYLLVLFALLGTLLMVSSLNFLVLYIGLELLSLALYALIALQRNSIEASEAGLKYFVLGSLASGMLLFGISLIYGATGSIDLVRIMEVTGGANPYNHILLLLGIIFVVVGICFKFGAVPFHMWIPDVYQGAPTSVTILVGSAPKIASVVFAYRILAEALGIEFSNWQLMLQIIAVASIFLGNVTAIMQTNIKRMLGYSTISHMGFVLLGLSANSYPFNSSLSATQGFSSAMFYAITYIAMALVAFGVIIAVSTKKHECNDIADLSGLNDDHPILACLMSLAMFSMAGIPPLMGFYAKFYVVKSLLAIGYVWISVFAIIMSLIAAYYYLRVVKVMYFDVPTTTRNKGQIDFTIEAKWLLTINGLALLIFGVFPEPIIRLCEFMFR